MQNTTMTKVLKRMLEMPVQNTQKPTLVSLSQVHFYPVCVKSTSMCSAEGLEHGSMIDPQAEQVEDQSEQPASDPEYPDASTGAEGEHTEL